MDATSLNQAVQSNTQQINLAAQLLNSIVNLTEYTSSRRWIQRGSANIVSFCNNISVVISVQLPDICRVTRKLRHVQNVHKLNNLFLNVAQQHVCR